MRRPIRDYITAAIDRTWRELDQYIEHLEVREPFPLVFDNPRASICEIRSLNFVPGFRGDFPEVNVLVVMQRRGRQWSVGAVGDWREMVPDKYARS